MNAIIYPLRFHLKSERRWAQCLSKAITSKAVAAKPVISQATVPTDPRHSPSHGTDTCMCGYVVTAPYASIYSPPNVVNKWHCIRCGSRWDTVDVLAGPDTGGL